MVISVFSFGNTLVGAGWAISVLCTNGLRNLAQKIWWCKHVHLKVCWFTL